MNNISLPVELAGRRYDTIHLGEALRRHCDEAGLSPVHMVAGRRLASSRAVLIEGLDKQSGRIALHASVHDGDETFRVDVALFPSTEELEVESTQCSCPRAAPCRHSVALSLDVASRGGSMAARPAFRPWLEDLIKITTSGKATAPKDLAFEQVWPSSLVRLVPEFEVRSGSITSSFDVKMGLAAVLGRGELFNAIDGRPITQDASRNLDLVWMVESVGTQRLGWGLFEGEVLLGEGQDLYLYHQGKATVSLVRYPRAVAEMLAFAPVLEASALSATLYRLRGLKTPFPLPSTMGGIDTMYLAPRIEACFTRGQAVSRSRDVLAVDRIEVRFRYDGHAIAPGSVVQKDGKQVRFMRDQRVEDRVLRALCTSGLELDKTASDNSMGHFSFSLESAGLHAKADLMLSHSDVLFGLGMEVELKPGTTMHRVRDLEMEVESRENQLLAMRFWIPGAEPPIDVTSALIDQIRRLDFPWEPRADEPEDARKTILVAPKTYLSLPLRRMRQYGLPLRECTEGLHIKPGEPVVLRPMQAVDFEALIGKSESPGAERLRQAVGSLAAARAPVVLPDALRATLRPYQLEGLSWLTFLAEANAGGVLADDMGLGKTVQLIAHILSERQTGRLKGPVLVVTPLTIMGVWREQCRQFAPDMPITCIHGVDREERYREVGDGDLVIMTYGTVANDLLQLQNMHWGLVIADEAHALKNPETQLFRSFQKLQRARTILASGTPIENRLLDLWAIIELAQPGFLGSRPHFSKLYKQPIEKHANVERQIHLRRKIRPLILRRLKSDVAGELPPKIQQVLHVPLEGPQRDHYESIRAALQDRVMNEVREKGVKKAGIVVLDALLRLRQVCCSPHLGKKRVEEPMISAKQELLLELLDSLVQSGRKILIFSQFAEMIDLISDDLKRVGVEHAVITGTCHNREAQVLKFKGENCPVMLLSLKVGSSGLNLQVADTVILYDPWWNGSIEAQAEDRAHRIGQLHQVTIYRLICPGTVEERVQAIAQRKLRMASALLDPNAAIESGDWLSEDEIEDLLGPIQD